MKSRLFLLSLFSALLLGGCGLFVPDGCDCGDHGEEVEGDCMCDFGWAGLSCELVSIDLYKGSFHRNADTCNWAGWDMDTITFTTNSAVPHSILIYCKGLQQPITGSLSKKWQATIDIPAQHNYRIDSAGGQTPIFIQGEAAKAWYDSTLVFTWDSSSCRLNFASH
jgi:hypothetical protein